jgi:hypothetical protein
VLRSCLLLGLGMLTGWLIANTIAGMQPAGLPLSRAKKQC